MTVRPGGDSIDRQATKWGCFSVRRSISLSDLLAGVPTGPAEESGTVAWAKKMALRTDPPVIPRLTYTESNYQWILLYEHVQRGQLDPRMLRKMSTEDLEFLAGHSSLHRDLIEVVGTSEQKEDALLRATKYAENITRATRELKRRSDWRVSAWSATIGGTVGAAVGGVVALLGRS